MAVEEEYRPLRPPTANGVEREQGQAAHQTPAKTTRTVPLEFKDTATGEEFDVVQDGDLSPNASAEPRTSPSTRSGAT